MSKLNVGQVIDLLSGYPSDLPVVVDGYEDGMTEGLLIERIKVAPNVYSEWWNGEHEQDPLPVERATLEVVAIHRHQT